MTLERLFAYRLGKRNLNAEDDLCCTGFLATPGLSLGGLLVNSYIDHANTANAVAAHNTSSAIPNQNKNSVIFSLSMAVLGGNDPHSYGVTSRRASMNTLRPKLVENTGIEPVMT